VSDAQRVIDEIDALVEEQLRQERSGYDHNLNQPHCRCGSPEWHGLPNGRCPGSDAEGPIGDAWGYLIGSYGDLVSGYDNGGRIEPTSLTPAVAQRWLESNDWVPLGIIRPRDGLTFDRRPDAPVVVDQQAIESYTAAAADLRRVVLAEWERISGAVLDTWATIREQFGALDPTAVQAAEREDGRPALPTGARTPPMWAVDVTRSRRGRQ